MWGCGILLKNDVSTYLKVQKNVFFSIPEYTLAFTVSSTKKNGPVTCVPVSEHYTFNLGVFLPCIMYYFGVYNANIKNMLLFVSQSLFYCSVLSHSISIYISNMRIIL
jgi:hypothetical protein